ncbi:hypothetical protein [Abyssalbus ytuae]|uniref:Uncharacterized protein n=1 Tax=Abyssalbus ytuae TaxID=2926907 RepID=A0A9E6ZRZ0_9FLAO|nr:hypothetical protein [Abyssalbus ytuae]UOB19385.1 hypothetical protein MQE35_08820 [Abyssalbus ytuae]
MWKEVFFLLLVTVLLSNCRNREKFLSFRSDTAHHEHTPAENIPSIYIEVKTDTILSNGFRVKTIYNSTNRTILKIIEEQPSQLKKVLYKEFVSFLEVAKDDEIIFEKNISKEFFNPPANDSFWKKAVLQFVEIDQLSSERFNNVVVKYSFTNVESKENRFYSLLIDEQGVYSIKKEN